MHGVDTDGLVALVHYHAWANDRILTTAAKVPDDELHRPDVLDRGSAFETLRHLVDVDWSWREFCIGNDIGDSYVWEQGFDLDDVAAIHAFCREEDARLRDYVASLDRAALDEQLQMSDDPNDVLPRWMILTHVVNHGTQHRSELAHVFTRCGHSPGDLDLLDAFDSP